MTDSKPRENPAPDPGESKEEETGILKSSSSGWDGWVTPPPAGWTSDPGPAQPEGEPPHDGSIGDMPGSDRPGDEGQSGHRHAIDGRGYGGPRYGESAGDGPGSPRDPRLEQGPASRPREPYWVQRSYDTQWGMGHGQETATIPEAPVKKRRSFFRRVFRDAIIPLAVAFALAMFAQAILAKPYQIPSGSMLPTIQLNDRILANRLIYRFSPIEHGDVVVFKPPANLDQETPYVKRVVGLPGDTVEIRNGKIMVNGVELIVSTATTPMYTKQPETVPDGMLFVLGDNRNESSDSHVWGFVPMDNVIGKAQLIYWPPSHFEWISH